MLFLFKRQLCDNQEITSMLCCNGVLFISCLPVPRAGFGLGFERLCAICYRNRKYKRQSLSLRRLVQLNFNGEVVHLFFLFFFCSLIVVNHSIIFLPVLPLISLSKINLHHLLCLTLMFIKTSNQYRKATKNEKKKKRKKKKRRRINGVGPNRLGPMLGLSSGQCCLI